MKKTTMMRIATTLLVAVLVTTCALGATFAKYVTTSAKGDDARVATWNIKMDNNGSNLFEYYYGTDVEAVENEDETQDDIVAPGTSNYKTFTVTGAPETDYIISFKAENIKDIYLSIGKYTYNANNDYVGMNATLENAEARYNPIEYTITINTNGVGTINGNFTEATANKYRTLKAALEDLAATTISYEANEEAGLTVTIAWNWAFDGEGQNDVYDTILGDLIANNSELTAEAYGTAEAADFSTEVGYKLTVTATQVNVEDITEG